MTDVLIPRTGAVSVRPVRTRDELREFLRLPHRLYALDRNWVAPLNGEIRAKLDPRRGPFFEHGNARLFLARRGGRTVGRISAQVDRRHNAFHSMSQRIDSTGFWGFFECEEDPEAAGALFDAAGRWLGERGMSVMVGPASFTLNDEAGLLVDGFDSPPMLLMTYNPPGYARLIEGAGFEGVQDLLAYRLDTTAEPPPQVVEEARVAARQFSFRSIRMHDFEAEMRRFLGVYNVAWERNWGFCPMTEREIREHAKALKPVLDPDLVLVGESGGEVAAVALTVPNVNEVLVRARGRLGPVTLSRLLWRGRRRRWDSCRVVALGVRPEFRQTGIGAQLYVETLAAARRGGYRWGEMSWILESNAPMNRAIRRMGGTVYKTYRMYARPV